jgi:hypothetical protein
VIVERRRELEPPHTSPRRLARATSVVFLAPALEPNAMRVWCRSLKEEHRGVELFKGIPRIPGPQCDAKLPVTIAARNIPV